METTEDFGNGLFGPVFGAFLIIYCAVLLLMLISMWKVFEKAGKPGWAAIIPIYNLIVWLDIVGKPTWWIILLLIPIVNIYFMVVITHQMSVVFGHGVGMTLLLIFLPIIAYPVLAFGNSQYNGPNAVAAKAV